MEHPGTGSNIILDISVRVLLDEMNILIGRAKQVALHSRGGPPLTR